MTAGWFLTAIKIILLIVYLICVLLSCKYWNVQLWKVGDKAARLLLDPATFNLKELIEIIDYRGVPDLNLHDRTNLSYMVNASGLMSEEEKWQSAIIMAQSKKREAINFTAENYLRAEIEDNTPGIWLLRIDTRNSSKEDILVDNLWDDVVPKLYTLGVQSGTIRCRTCPTICRKNNWTKSDILLLRTTASDSDWSKEILYYPGRLANANSSSILIWMRHHLNSHINHFSTRNFPQLRETIKKQSGIHVILFSTLTVAPTFISSLAIKFSGRINFSMVTIKTINDTIQNLFANEFNVEKLPTYRIFTPEKNFTYGNRHGEYYGYHCMHEFLTSLYPATNDIFVAIVIGINLMCLLKLLLIDGTFLACLLKFIILFCQYNFAVVLLWFPMYNFFTSPLMHIVYDLTMMVMRCLMGTDFVAAIRRSTHLTHPGCLFMLLTESIIFASVIYYWIECQEGQISGTESMASCNYLSLSSYQSSLYSILTYRSACERYSREDIEEGIDILIEHFAIPKLYVQPLVPMDYIQSLPTFTYGDKIRFNHPTWKEKLNWKSDNTEIAQLEENITSEQDYNCDDNQCSICLTNYINEDYLCCLPCSHVFHHDCIVQWLSIGTINTCRCPLCRWPAYRSYLQPS
ncbi:E3 ubiquitin-protein ligase RNF103 [Trichoplax sp. H2]|nr:E3 ubiquitin-protein ligase RNF103 [Trichoplax sp. H2]|eukprot:RDD41950.1 E3 ubiquitin-protein ligase RNF103 [Trichoplax sp. H2]